MTANYGKYALQRKLAEGGMAELFLAKQLGLEGFEKIVVVKRILPQLSADDSFVGMFLNEARVAARLNHPNVVQIFDLGKLDQQYFIAMEYVHGEDLRTIIREAGDDRRPSLGLCCRVLADALAGLHYAHTRAGADGKPLGLVHRDVSPQNVLVTYEGAIKIVDFGIAKATRAVGAAQTQAGLLKGKYAYMSPEQARGGSIDARADVFCAGVLLWELATWTRLFKRPTEMATLMAVVEERIPSPREIDPSVPLELDHLVAKALARNPDDRFASAQELRAALETLIRKQGWEADALALQQYMRDLFAPKLQQQAADIAAAGMASLEDFLLTVEEKTSISWIRAPGEDKKTPSSGLPMTPPFGSHILDDGPTPRGSDRDTFDDGPTTQAPDDVIAAGRAASRPDATIEERGKPGAPPKSPPPATRSPVPASKPLAGAPKGPPPPTKTPPPPTKTPPPLTKQKSGAQAAPRPKSGPQFVVPDAQLATVRAATSPHNETVPSLAPPSASPESITLRPSAPPAFGVGSSDEVTLGPPKVPLTATPTATTAGVILPAPAAGAPQDRTLPGLTPEATRISGEQPIAYGPQRPTARHPAWIPPSRWRRVLVAGSVAVAVGAIALTVALWPTPDDPAPSPQGPPSGLATLIIDVDAPADIAVDGKPQPRGQSATVNVQPGVEHEVTVQSAGHAARRLHVPALAPGEHLPLKVSLR